MREPTCCLRVRHRLSRHGFSPARIDSIVQELAEHWQDLQAAGLDQGMTAAEAAAHADHHLGDPDRLSGEIIERARSSSWMGRHPVLSIVVFPLLMTPMGMAVILLPLFQVKEMLPNSWASIVTPQDPVVLARLLIGLYWTLMAGSTLWLCHRVWQRGLGIRWVTALTTFSLLAALMRHLEANASRRTVALSISFPWSLDLTTFVVTTAHVLLLAAFVAKSRQQSRISEQRLKESQTLSL